VLLATWQVGSPLSLSGPWGSHEYLGRGRFLSDGLELSCTSLGMMAGGTGLTPMLQIIAAVLKEPAASGVYRAQTRAGRVPLSRSDWWPSRWLLAALCGLLTRTSHDRDSPLAAPVMSLLLANQTEDDILVRDKLERLQELHPTRFSLHYTLDRPPTKWAYSSGFITKEMIAAQLPPPGEQTLVLMCGPPPMVKFACRQNLDALGYPAERQISF
jgi:cytochrome-b5 reductase